MRPKISVQQHACHPILFILGTPGLIWTRVEILLVGLSMVVSGDRLAVLDRIVLIDVIQRFI
jgi:hypothetical protein